MYPEGTCPLCGCIPKGLVRCADVSRRDWSALRMYPEGTGPLHGCIPKGKELKEIYKFPRFFQPNPFLRMLQRATFIHAVVFEEENVTVVCRGVEEELFFC